MDPKRKTKPIALLIADLVVLNGIVMGVLYLSSKQWMEAFGVLLLAVLGGVYLVRNGVYWPGQYILRYWRRYVL